METFIVRIYRGVTTSAQELAGTVERVGSGDRVGFSGHAQMLDCVLVMDRRSDGGNPSRRPADASEPRDGT